MYPAPSNAATTRIASISSLSITRTRVGLMMPPPMQDKLDYYKELEILVLIVPMKVEIGAKLVDNWCLIDKK